MTTTRAAFTIRHQGPVVALVDLAEARHTMSVTNDAENVVRYLYEQGVVVGSTRLVYRDTTGQWDEIAHDGRGRFLDFIVLGAQTLDEAVRRITT